MNELQADLEKQLDELAQARARAEAVAQLKRDILDVAKKSEAFRKAEAAGLTADEIVAAREAIISDNTLALYLADFELPDRVAVKNFTVVAILDELKAKEWCIAHFTPALKLDSKVFEKAAKDGHIPAELATVTKEPRAQIATKL